jgi:hypothetical protein
VAVQIHQAVAIPRDRSEDAVGYVANFVRDLLQIGFIRQQLASAGQDLELANE